MTREETFDGLAKHLAEIQEALEPVSACPAVPASLYWFVGIALVVIITLIAVAGAIKCQR